MKWRGLVFSILLLVVGSKVQGASVEVTNDAALDWSPVWSPQGDYLYFSSNRGGTTNLWRMAIDERSGRVTGEPEPVTTPSGWSGSMSFTAGSTTCSWIPKSSVRTPCSACPA